MIATDTFISEMNNLSGNFLPAKNERLGRVTRVVGMTIEASGISAEIGAQCEIEIEGKGRCIDAEVIGFDGQKIVLMPIHFLEGIKAGCLVRLAHSESSCSVGEALLGRVVDGSGEPIDGKGDINYELEMPLDSRAINPMARGAITEVLDTGVKSINGCLTFGKGQRVGLIAGSGVGKSVLMAMLTRNTEADIVVVGMIGERGREVGSFVKTILSGEAKKRTAVVAVPADRSPLLRIRGAERATAIAEFFRDQGKNVLLIMDSLTRVAHARREIGLALGEQPTSKGYPPSVVSMIPRLIERTGSGIKNQGTITAIYTVLADGDDTNDRVVDTARAILDGHILLSRKQTQMGIYPAIDVPMSISRVMSEITDETLQKSAQKFRRLVSLYMENRDLILMGGYTSGQDPELDEAVALWPRLMAHIQQVETQKSDFSESKDALNSLMK